MWGELWEYIGGMPQSAGEWGTWGKLGKIAGSGLFELNPEVEIKTYVRSSKAGKIKKFEGKFEMKGYFW